MEFPIVSVVIPVYNVAPYLKDCVNSVLSQSLKNIEILLVDDGSTDSSGLLCEELVEKDDRVRVFHKANGGLSSARNYGKDNAIGKYIIFLDSDDYWIETYALELLVVEAEKHNLDIVRGEYIEVNSGGELLRKPDISFKLCHKDSVIDSYYMFRDIICGEFFAVLFLYKRECINNLYYDENRKFQEDIDFSIRCFCRDQRCGYLPLFFYAYRKHQNTMTSKPSLININASFSLCNTFHHYSSLVKDKRLTPLYISYGIMMYCSSLVTVAEYCHNSFSTFREIETSMNLVELQKQIRDWGKDGNRIKYPLQFYVSPFIGFCLLRVRSSLNYILYKLKGLISNLKIRL